MVIYLLNILKNLEQRKQDFIPRADKHLDMFCLIKHGQINDFLPLVDNADCHCCQRKPCITLLHHDCIIVSLSYYRKPDISDKIMIMIGR